jgi:hypothetical protein
VAARRFKPAQQTRAIPIVTTAHAPATDAVALDARDLHQLRDGAARHAEMVLRGFPNPRELR